MTRKILLLLSIVIWFSSCKILKPSMMFRTPRDFVFDSLPDSINIKKAQYDIMPNDVVSFQIYSNDGFKLIDLAGSELGIGNKSGTSLSFTIDPEGFLKLPVIGKVYLVGKTIKEAELYLEDMFSKYYNKPFIILSVTSRRVYVFPGAVGSAKSISIPNNNTSLIEVLTQIGGIQGNGKAYKIRLIRDYDLPKPKVYQVDLSRIEGLKFATLPVQNHDIIYVVPSPQYAQSITNVIGPYLGLISTSLVIIGYYKILTK